MNQSKMSMALNAIEGYEVLTLSFQLSRVNGRCQSSGPRQKLLRYRCLELPLSCIIRFAEVAPSCSSMKLGSQPSSG
jgi:hypothetical protein